METVEFNTLQEAQECLKKHELANVVKFNAHYTNGEFGKKG
jgi:hypothetical protein